MEYAANWKSLACPSTTNWSQRKRRCRLALGRQRQLVGVCVASVVILVCLKLGLSDPLGRAPDIHHNPPPDVTLLIWAQPFERSRPLPDCQALYDISGCYLTEDQDEYSEADAVIFHHREIATHATQLPTDPRPHAQKWIWMNFESPTHTPGLWELEGVFNLTMTYRSDSDIFLPYGFLVPVPRWTQGPPPGRTAPLAPSSRRPRLVAWVISNWSEAQARVAFYYQLVRHVRVDVFGRAGRALPEGGGGGGGVVRLARRYQFYLALENSQHTDYITEKLWNAVVAGAVPVVLGPPRDNYERFLPPEAFIHADDFPSARGLARYLLLLHSSPALLRRHLAWRRSYRVQQPAFWGEHYCAACRAVGDLRGRTNRVTHLARWFHS
ncbi:unnamed protein product [Gadus morhua 'NCC']